MRTAKAMLATMLAAGGLATLSACDAVSGRAQPNAAAVVATTSTSPESKPSTSPKAPPPKTVYVQPPTTRTVVVEPPADTAASDQWYAQSSWIDSVAWIDITPAAGQTPCKWLFANGYSYAEAFAAWAHRGYPASWSATNDGYPCQKSYGMQH